MTNANGDITGSTSPTLIRRAQGRDTGAWQRLANLYTPLVYGWARQVGLNSADAADVVQDVFRAVFTNISRFRHDDPGNSFRGWLWTITRNQVRLHFRKRADRPVATGGTTNQQLVEQIPNLPDRADDATPPDAQKSFVHRALRIIRADFSEKTWQAFWRLTVEGRPAAEIADDLNMNPRSVRQAKYRVLSRLREEIAEH